MRFSCELVHPQHGVWRHRARLGGRVVEMFTFTEYLTEEEARKLVGKLGPVSDWEPEAPGA